MKDKRSQTSRENLGKHIPEALSPIGTTSIAVRVPNDLLIELDWARGHQTRSSYLRNLIADGVERARSEP